MAAGFSAATRAWFDGAFAEPTQAQTGAWEAIGNGDDALVVAPTGSGKTLAAFLWAIDRLAATPPPADAKQRCRVLYVSPLKALAVDIERNLRAPLTGIKHAAHRLGLPEPDIRVAVRTGDTSADERRKLTSKPADILITTPESLFLLLTSAARETLRSIETVIVDEVHAVAASKRGAHLALSLERLDALRPENTKTQRIGLSATVRPVDAVATFLGGGSRRVAIVQPPATKKLELKVVVPVEDMTDLETAAGPGRGNQEEDPAARRSIWPHVEERVLDLIEEHKSTIVFANSRRLAERLCGKLNELASERAGEDTEVARAHHGSVSRLERLEIEEALKAGRLPAVVATSSLELGIDMGAVDLVVQVESPPSVAGGLQRVGRAAQRGRRVPRHHLPQVPGRPGAGRRGRDPDEAGPDRRAQSPAQPPGRARPAGRGHGRDGRVAGRRPRKRRPQGRAVRQPDPARAGRGARHAGRPVPQRGVRRAAAADRLGSHTRHDPGPPGRTAAGGDQRRDDPRSRAVRRVPAGQRRQPAQKGRRAGRGDGVRVAGGRGVRARRQLVADRGHHPRPGHRHAGAGRDRQAAVLARRRARRPPSWARRSAARSGNWRPPPAARPQHASPRPAWTSWPRRTCSGTSKTSARPPATCQTTARWWWSGSATSWATGGWCCTARTATGCTRRGRWRSPPGCASATRTWTCRRCTPTTASSSGCRTPTSRRRPGSR